MKLLKFQCLPLCPLLLSFLYSSATQPNPASAKTYTDLIGNPGRPIKSVLCRINSIDGGGGGGNGGFVCKEGTEMCEGRSSSWWRWWLRRKHVLCSLEGLSAGLLRQATYTTARLGSFRILTNKAIEANEGKPLPLYQKALCGLTAGAIGATVGSPADLALIHMQADATLPLAQRRHYTNAFHALGRIVSDEGVLALWKGAGPTVVRAMALNMGMLASCDQGVEGCKYTALLTWLED